MVIARGAIDDFLNAKTDDYRWIKNCTKQELAEVIEEQIPWLKLRFEPYTHQLACFYLGATIKKFLFFLDMGLGKGVISIALIDYFFKTEELKKPVLVVVPYVANIMSWKEEIAKFSTLKAVGLHSSSPAKRKQLLEEPADIYIINYGGLPVLMTEFKQVSKKKRKRQPDKTLITAFANRFGGLCLDEIHICRNHQSLTFKLCKELAHRMELVYGLTGTPFGKDPGALWSQFYLIDKGETLGPTLGLFRSAFFDGKPNRWGGVDYTLKPLYKNKLTKKIQHRSIRYTTQECVEIDLPPLREIQIPLVLPEDARQLYNEYLSELRKSERNKIENASIKLRELCSGFLYTNDEESNERVTINLSSSYKEEALLSILESSGDCKAILFYVFEESKNMIKQLLTKHKIQFVTPQETKNEQELTKEFRKFQNNKKCKLAILNVRTGGIGLNLQIANYCIFYEPTVMQIEHNQAMKRLSRIGQKNWVYIYHFFVKGSIEESTIQSGHDGRKLFESIIDGKSNLMQL